MSAGECDSLTSSGLVDSGSDSVGGYAGGTRHWLAGSVPKASEIYDLHRAAHMALSNDAEQLTAARWVTLPEDTYRVRPTASTATKQADVAAESDPPAQASHGRFSPSQWLQRHPILGHVLGHREDGQLEVEVTPAESPRSAIHLSPRSAARSPSAKASALDGSSAGVRAVDEEILKLLNELLKGQQEARDVSSGPAADEARRAAAAAEEAAQLAKDAMKATRKQHLSIGTFMALGVKDHRLLLLDYFLAWNGLRSRKASAEARTKDAMAQASSDDERPSLPLENLQVARRVPAGMGPVPPILPGHTLRALLGEEVFLNEDGSIRGASLLLSMRPPRATRQFLQNFDICLPWTQVQEDSGHKPSLEVSIQTSPRGTVPQCEAPQDPHAGLTSPVKDDLTPEQVLRRISGLQAEMSEMEMSLDQLRQEFEAEPEETTEDAAKKGRKGPMASKVLDLPRPKKLSRLRQRLPESLSWLEEAARTGGRFHRNLPRM